MRNIPTDSEFGEIFIFMRKEKEMIKQSEERRSCAKARFYARVSSELRENRRNSPALISRLGFRFICFNYAMRATINFIRCASGGSALCIF